MLVLIFGISALGYFYHGRQVLQIRSTKERQLLAVSQLKLNEIENWRNERVADGNTIAGNIFLIREIRHFLENPGDDVLKRELLSWMACLRDSYGYEKIVLLDAEGNVSLNLGEEKEFLCAEERRCLRESIAERKVFLSDFYRDEKENGAIRLGIFLPLGIPENTKDVPAGAMILELDPDRFLYPLIQFWPTPSPSSETLLVRREGEEIVFLNELRHRKNTALILKIPVTKRDLPAAMAVSGKEGLVEGRDYRGIPVIGAIRKIPDSSWLIVAKTDREEVFREVNRAALITLVLTVFMVLAVGAGLGFFWSRQRANYYRREYETELERQAFAKHFDYLVKYANDIILLMDENLRIFEVNDRAVAVYGYSREELLRMNLRELCSSRMEAGYESLKGRAEDYDGVLFEAYNRKKDGTEFPVEVSARFIEVEGKVFYQNIIRDTSERKQAVEALKRSEGEMRMLLKSMINAFVVFDSVFDGDGRFTSYRFVYINEAYERITGVKNEDVRGKTVHEVWPGTEASWVKAYGEVAVTGKTNSFEMYHEPTKKLYYCQVYRPYPTNEKFCVIFEDITERKRMEEELIRHRDHLEELVEIRSAELKKANKELEVAYAESRAFSYSVSHDLRAPLRAIDGFSQMLRKNHSDRLDEEGRRILGVIGANVRLMNELIEGLLALSSLEYEPGESREVDMTEIVKGIADELRSKTEDRDLRFEIGTLPSVSGDRRLLQQVFYNLLANSVKFSKLKERAVIEVSGSERDHEAVYCVKDNGAGFDMQYKDKLFGIFQRLHPFSAFEGTGIGLALVQRIVQRHGGRVWAEGKVDEGAAFYFALPVTRETK